MVHVEDVTDEIFEVLEPIEKDWVQKFFGELTKASAPKQLAAGGIAGWCAGNLFAKISKKTAAALGGGLLLVQIGAYQGYITINRSKIKQEVKKAKKRVNKALGRNYQDKFLDQAFDFVRENAVLAGGFATGFLLGVSL